MAERSLERRKSLKQPTNELLGQPSYIYPQRLHSMSLADLQDMCRKRTFGEVAGKRIVCNENITCLTTLALAFRDRVVKHIIF